MNFFILINIIISICIIHFVCKDVKISTVLIIVVLLSSIPSILYSDVIPLGHDILFHINRVRGIVTNFSEKNIPYRINNYTFLTYGSQDPIFYPYVFLIIPALFNKLLNESIMSVFNAFIILINTFTAISMYKSAYGIYKNKYIAILSSIFYVLSVYRITDIYTRAAYGEILAFIFLPILIWGMYELVIGEYKKYYIFVIGATGIAMSHILTTIFAAILFLFFILLSIKEILNEKKRIIYILLSCFIVFCLNAWFILPLVYEFIFVNFIKPFTSNDVFWQNYKIPELFLFRYDFLEYKPIGLTVIFGFVVLLIAFVKSLNFDKIKSSGSGTNLKIHVSINYNYDISIKLLIISLITFLLMFIPYRFYMRIPLVNKLAESMQFSFRLMIIFLPVFFIVISYYINFLFKRLKILILIIVFSVSVFSSFFYMFDLMKNGEFYLKDILHFYTTEYCIKSTVLNEDKNLEEYISKSLDAQYSTIIDQELYTDKVICSDNINIVNENRISNGYFCEYEKIDNSEDSYIEFPIFAYPIFKAYNNEKPVEIFLGKNNKIKIHPRYEKGSIYIIQRELDFWIIGDFISFTIVVIYMILFIVKFKKKYKEKDREYL